MLPLTCYVLGCRQRTTVSAYHPAFRMVSACQDHSPIKHGIAKPLIFASVATVPLAAVTPPASPSSGSGGAKVPRVPAPVAPSSPAAVTPPRPATVPPVAPRRPQPVADPF